MPTGEMAVFSVERRYETGPFTREDCLTLDPLRPHLARATLLASRASVERARTMSNTLQALGLPGAVVHLNGRLMTANPMFEQLIPTMITDGRDRVHLTSASADRLLGEALSVLCRSTVYRGVSSIPIPSDQNSNPKIVHLIPAHGVAQDFFLSGSVIMLITPVEPSSAPAIKVLQGLFDLTPTEAKVAQGICGALSVDAVAASLGIKRETVRTHMKAVMAKTGVKRQGELISILAGKHFPLK